MSNVQGLRLLLVAPLNCNGEDQLPDVGPWTLDLGQVSPS